ncbi:MAG TPA: bifunctional ornithine acetyltransferase/N-acetylglutamate synthase [Planctomycetota bacterium]|nr:bifunctional ornithine acetyltransferase/N-acetylglutamate synthase [Planctomycetota bacterium]
MPSTDLKFANADEHRAWLTRQAALPRGWRVGATRFEFQPAEVRKTAKMTITLIAPDKPVESVAAMFTKNAFPGAPVIIGRKRMAAGTPLAAIVINNKVSNVCAPNGVATAERLCERLGQLMNLEEAQILPSSTGVIGWRLPIDFMINALPAAVESLQGKSILPAAEGIVTTDLYPKIRRVELPGGATIVGIAKGAGMIEPNLATMLVYVLTDADIVRNQLQRYLEEAVEESFNCISIDSDTSTSDTVVCASTRAVPCPDLTAFRLGLFQVCSDLAEDVVRNGEGVHHVIRVAVGGAPDYETARAIGKAVVNSPLFQCAVCGNDANVGRLIAAIGKEVGARHEGLDLSGCSIAMGGESIYEGGVFHLDPDKERRLVAHLKAAEMYASVAPKDGLTFVPPMRFPPHERAVEIEIDLGAGDAACLVVGADRSHEYISENADYRS